ncbi:MAG TPA: chitobiase/beta-hexosaminidase C-terminal domain-containing protein [Cytophagaceae bacterium]
MKIIISLLISFLFLHQSLLAGQSDTTQKNQVIAMHLLNYGSDADLQYLATRLHEFAEKGVNTLILEVDYNFDFKSHPELRAPDKYITLAGARQFAQRCKKLNIRVIPEFQSLGHQSWAEHTFSLLTKYPELDLTPGAFPQNKGIYCREWDPTNPRVNQIIFPMIDEIIDAFQADGIHVGMDEIFLLGAKESPTTYGKDPGELFAKVVNEFHDHFVKEKKVEMYLWGDRLIDAKKYPYGDWEASSTGSATAVDKIPTDIIICDWHYGLRDSYPSIPMFLEKGFKVLPCSYIDPLASKALIKHSLRQNHPNMLGHMFTSWSSVPKDSILIYPAFTEGMAIIKNKKIWDIAIDVHSTNTDGTLSISLACEKKDLSIYYTLDGSEPGKNSLLYQHPFKLEKTATIKAKAFYGTEEAGEVCSNSFMVHKATGKTVKLTTPPSSKYATIGGPSALVNGITSTKAFNDGQWCGFEGVDIEAVIDLGSMVEISEISLNTFNDPQSWIMPANKMQIWVSEDGLKFEKVGEVKGPRNNKAHTAPVTAAIGNRKASIVKIIIPKVMLPADHPGAGNAAWILLMR